MLFNSYEFILLFLPITFLIYFFISKRNSHILSAVWLIIASLFFYSWWNIIYLPIIVFSIIVNYMLSSMMIDYHKKISPKISKKQLLYISLFLNIGLLAYFKYMDFFITMINISGLNFSLLNLALPLAISFFTLQQIAYLVDSYEGLIKKNNFLNYTLFVTFFPQLIAGPIVHHKEMMPQFLNIKNKEINHHNISAGIFIFSIGLFKKVVLADTFGQWADTGYSNVNMLTLFEAWATSLSYTFQLYFDFSGYADMAIGAALLFNIKLPINFDSPYKATNIQDFWRRWHITLSRFLKDYVYIPFGGSRKGDFRTYNNLLATFIIGGIWHGAGWTFVFWGFLHGIALIIHRAWCKVGFKIWTWLAWLITFNFINITWVFFRADSFNDIGFMLKALFGFNGIVLPSFLVNKLSYLADIGIEFGGIAMHIGGGMDTFKWLIMGFVVILLFDNSVNMKNNHKPSYISAMFASLLFLYSLSSIAKHSTFLYFNF